MARRRLTPEEISLWHQVIDKAEQLHPAPSAQPHQRPLPKPKPKKLPAQRPNGFEVGASAPARPSDHDLFPGITAHLSKSPVQMDRRTFGRMKRGKLVPEARIDLHGMTLDRAHPALTRFILSSQATGRRLVLVITGKGKPGTDTGPIPTRRGVLKHQVPQWLSIPPLAQAVLQITQAHIGHGGEGAYYVYLRKTR